MRYILRRESGGDWGVWDTRKQMYFCQGLNAEEATKTAEKKNKRNNRRVKKIIQKNVT